MTDEKVIEILENEMPCCGEKVVYSEEERCEAYDKAISAIRAQKRTNIPLTLDELREIIEQIESCHYECEAGPLESNVAFICLKEAAYRHKPEE